MNSGLQLCLVALLAVSCAQQTPSRVVPKYSIEQFYQNVNIRGGSFSDDETRLLISSNESGIYNVYALPVDGSPAEQLTESTVESFFAAGYVPGDKGFLYSADQGGNENSHIYWVDSQNNTTDLTPWEGARSIFFAWSHNRQTLFFQSNKRNPQFFDLYKRSLSLLADAESSQMLYQNDEGLDVAAVSDNERYMALVKTITTSNNEMYLYDRQTGQKKHLSPHSGDAQYEPQFFDVTGENLYFLSNDGSEFMYLACYNLTSGETSRIFETNWDVLYAYSSHKEKYRVIGVNEDGKTAVHVFSVADGATVDLPDIAGASIASVNISRSEKRMRMTASTSSSPSNMYVYDLESKKLTPLTNTLNPEMDADDLVEGRVVRYKSFDGVEIPAIYYQPHSASKDKRVPALVWVHGGPGGQSRLSYFALIQFLVNHDYAVLAVNNRGSSGYGKTFNKMDDRNHGDKDLKDCIWGKDFLATTGVVDTGRVGIIGGSYGGYMVMAALAFEPEAFDVGVNIFGVTNWLRTLKSIPPYWESFREALFTELGDPFSADSVRLYNISPVFHGKNVVKPLMVLQGANDPRVLQVESDEIVAAVRANNVPVEYVLFGDEGHGFRKKENEIEGYGKILTFLDEHLKKANGERMP